MLSLHLIDNKWLHYLSNLFNAYSYDHPDVLAGQGSIGIEIIEQLPTVDAVLIPVGGGSLLTGIGISVKHLKPDTEIYVRNNLILDFINGLV